MADFRVPVWQTSIVVEGVRYAANANGIITVPEDLADEVARLGGIRDGGGFSVATWADAAGSAVVAPDGSSVAVDGEGGGATMFTALTDAPAVIQPSRIVTGNDDGSALTFSDNVLQVPETGSLFVVPLNPDTNEYGGALSVVGSGDFTADADTFAGGLSFPSATAWADLATSGVTLRTGDGGQAGLAINADNVALEAIGGRTLKVGGFDVVASDASAHMTVGGVEYSIAKAIKVQIGSDIFFWPLFGPV